MICFLYQISRKTSGGSDHGRSIRFKAPRQPVFHFTPGYLSPTSRFHWHQDHLAGLPTKQVTRRESVDKTRPISDYVLSCAESEVSAFWPLELFKLPLRCHAYKRLPEGPFRLKMSFTNLYYKRVSCKTAVKSFYAFNPSHILPDHRNAKGVLCLLQANNDRSRHHQHGGLSVYMRHASNRSRICLCGG